MLGREGERAFRAFSCDLCGGALQSTHAGEVQERPTGMLDGMLDDGARLLNPPRPGKEACRVHRG